MKFIILMMSVILILTFMGGLFFLNTVCIFMSGLFRLDTVRIMDNPSLGSTIAVTSDIVKSGSYAFKFTVNDPQSMRRAMLNFYPSIKPLKLKDAYFSFDVYFPPDFDVAKPSSNIFFEIMQKHNDTDWRILMALQQRAYSTEPTKPRLFLLHNGQGSDVELWHDRDYFTFGKWINFIVHFLYDENGNVKVWQDGVLKADIDYDSRCYDDSPAPYPNMGLYENIHAQSSNWLVMDNIIVKRGSLPLDSAPNLISPWMIIVCITVTKNI